MQRNLRNKEDRDAVVECSCGAVLAALAKNERVSRSGVSTEYVCPKCGKTTRIRVERT